jgi:hypothetical protein
MHRDGRHSPSPPPTLCHPSGGGMPKKRVHTTSPFTRHAPRLLLPFKLTLEDRALGLQLLDLSFEGISILSQPCRRFTSRSARTSSPKQSPPHQWAKCSHPASMADPSLADWKKIRFLLPMRMGCMHETSQTPRLPVPLMMPLCPIYLQAFFSSEKAKTLKPKKHFLRFQFESKGSGQEKRRLALTPNRLGTR